MTALPDRLAVALADRYRIECELGAGGMATVYLAQDFRHRRKVALKVLRPELAAVIGAERFLKEIETTANLQHANILPLYDSGEADSFLYYVMPYVEGETLRGKLTREKQLSVEETVSIAKSVAAALEYAHRRGVIHRDIKPENILLPEGQALVADFGIALAVSQAGGTRMTETGLSLGTPHYMSPEQAAGDRELTPRSDIYSLGAMTYEMLTGDPPHTGSTVQAIVAKVLSEPPTPISRTRQLVPSNVDAAVQRALAKTPADRFGSAAEFAAALTNPGFTLPTMASGARSTAAGAERAWKAAALGLAALLLVMVGVAGWSRFRKPNPPPAPVTRAHLVLPAGQRLITRVRRLALSTDGTLLAYVGEAPDGGQQIWLRPLNALEAREVPGTRGATAPFFSPDGEWLGFIAGGKVRKARVSGGPVVEVADSANGDLAGATWLSDGTIVFTHRNFALYRVSADGGPATQMPPVDSLAIVLPRALPRADAVLYTTCTNLCSSMTVGALDLRTGKHTQLADDASGAWYVPTGDVVYLRRDGAVFRVPFDLGALAPRGPAVPVFEGVQVIGRFVPSFTLSPTGTLVFVPGSSGTGGSMVRVDRMGKAAPLDPSWPPALLFSAALAPDGSHLAVEIADGQRNDIWIKELDRGSLTRVSFGAQRNRRPAWTPDSKAVSFVVADSSWHISVRRPDGTGEIQRIDPPDSLGQPETHQWTPDRAWLVLQTRKSARRDLYALKLGSDTVLRIAAAPEADEIAPALSPDGRWIAYSSTETGRAEVYVRPFPDVTRERRQVSRQGGTVPAWSADGRELFFVSEGARDARGLQAAEVRPGAQLVIGEPRPVLSVADYFISQFFVGYFPERNGQSFLFYRSTASSEVAPLVLVLNWAEELRPKTSR